MEEESVIVMHCLILRIPDWNLETANSASRKQKRNRTRIKHDYFKCDLFILMGGQANDAS